MNAVTTHSIRTVLTFGRTDFKANNLGKSGSSQPVKGQVEAALGYFITEFGKDIAHSADRRTAGS